MRVGFVGLGLMGRPKAANVLAAGHEQSVYNRSPGRDYDLVGAGARRVASLADLAEASDAVLVCVSDDDAVRQVIGGRGGVLDGVRRGSVIVDHSTVAPAVTRELAVRAFEKGVGYIDAPVSGGVTGAEKGTLVMMVGGETTHVEQARAVMDAMAAHIIHCGPVGAGNVVKLVNNMIGAVNLAAAVEGVMLGAAAGVDPGLVLEAINRGSGRSAASEYSLPNKVLKGDFEPGFSIDLMSKDLRLALDLAQSVTMPVPHGSAALQSYTLAQAHALGGRDVSAVIVPLEEAMRREVRSGRTPS
jgi:3-hydroxyisobutyrate dehydrogenase-like beta-hydroxyacid dehydrogenase